MKTNKSLISLLILLAVACGPRLTARAQTAWTGATSSDWNTAGNWTNGVPGVGVLAFLTNNSTVTYAAPMSATTFGGLDTAGRSP